MLFPYLNGEDLNSRPDASASRWVIDFNDRSEPDAATFEMPYTRVTEQVLPERMRNKRKARRDAWWQFAERATGMRTAISNLPEVLVIALVSKTVMPMRVRTGQVFSHKLGVFATDSFALQAALSSSLHQAWAVKYGSTMRADVNYSPSDVFDTFPMPTANERMDELGRALHKTRHEVMSARNLGLTKLYNLINDPTIDGDDDIDRLRALHADIDEATIDSFGWDDLSTDHGFHQYRQMVRWSISPGARAEVLDRLLLENHRRAHEGGASVEPVGLRVAPGQSGTLFE